MPYLETNYLAAEGLNNFGLESGISLKIFSNRAISESAEQYHIKGELLNVKTGVRFQNLNPSFYCSIGTDLLNLMIFLWGNE